MEENEKLNVGELDITLGDDYNENESFSENNEQHELSEEEERELYIEQLKKMHIRFNPIKHVGNKTINPYGVQYKQKRKKRNKVAKASRKTNRKK